MSITRTLLKCVCCMGAVMLGLVLIARPIGKVIPHGQFIPIRVENIRQAFMAWYLLDFNRGITKRLFNEFATTSTELFSSDGEHIMQTSFTKPDHKCIWSVYSWADGKTESVPVLNTCTIRNPNWSDDNRYIVFNKFFPGDLFVLSLENGEIQQVYHDANSNRYAAWSPDGKLLAFLPLPLTPPTSSSGEPLPLIANSIEFIRMDCHATCQPANTIFATLPYPVLRLSWSPGQSQIAFFSNGYGVGTKLYVWDAACLTEKVPDCKIRNSQLRQIVLKKAVIFDDVEPIWSSDGQYLMFGAVLNRHTGFYRVPSNCSDSADGCKPELVLDFDKVITSRFQ